MLSQDSHKCDIVKELEYDNQKITLFKDGSTMLSVAPSATALYLSFEDLHRLALEARLGKAQ